MKKILYLFMVIVSITVNAQIKRIDLANYTVHYDEQYPGPVMVEYTLFKTTTPDSVHREDKWEKYPAVKTPKPNEWKSTGFDKGHLAPAETFSQTPSRIQSTFTYINCTFQHNKLNRETWRILEKKELDISRTDSLKVYTGCLYLDKTKVTKLGSVIPTHFWRIIINHTDKSYIAFLFENKEVEKNPIKGRIDLVELNKRLKLELMIKNYRELKNL
jgi:endonuclease G